MCKDADEGTFSERERYASVKEQCIYPAIVAVGYNRAESLARLLRSLENASYPTEDIRLIVSIDKSECEAEVLSAIDGVAWTHGTRTVRTFEARQGLRKHILSCGDLSAQYGAVIILEDDLIVSPSFYYFAMQGVNRYYEDERICGTALYRHAWNSYAELSFAPVQNAFDAFFGQIPVTWGQCWTDRQWSAFRTWYAAHEDRLPAQNDAMPTAISHWDERSWGKYFATYIAETERCYVIPYTALSTNASEAGEHNRVADNAHQVALLDGVKKTFCLPDFDEGIRYDIFFERIFADGFRIGGIDAKDICVNVNGIKRSTLGRRYVLTADRSQGTPIASFGLSLRPVDANITAGTPGEDILLVKAEGDALMDRFKHPGDARCNYELYHFYWGVLLKEGWKRFLLTLKGKLSVLGKRLLKR